MFISPDSIVPNWYNPQSLNPYSYCRNNPLIYIDPSGNVEIYPNGQMSTVAADVKSLNYQLYADMQYSYANGDWGYLLADTVCYGINSAFTLPTAYVTDMVITHPYNAGIKSMAGWMYGDWNTALRGNLELLSLGIIGKYFDAPSSTSGEAVAPNSIRVRHHTNNEYLNGINKDMAINPSRSGGVDVEMQPFGSTNPGLGGPKARTGAAYEGAYVEFDAPATVRPTYISNYPNTNTGTITTTEPLSLQNLNPKFVQRPWWKRIFD